MKTLFPFLAALLAAAGLHATAQTPDVLRYRGRTYELHVNPLEPYFEQHPERRPRGDGYSGEFIEGFLRAFVIEYSTKILTEKE